MKLYRTVTLKEFINLLIGETILPKEQKSSVCSRNLNGKFVSADKEPFEAVCTFCDKLFWAVERTNQYILLELDIPEDRILFSGYGVYSSYFYNKHFNKESYWMTNGAFGQARRGLKNYKISEFLRRKIVNRKCYRQKQKYKFKRRKEHKFSLEYIM
jgi:hypothetical protein